MEQTKKKNVIDSMEKKRELAWEVMFRMVELGLTMKMQKHFP